MEIKDPVMVTYLKEYGVGIVTEEHTELRRTDQLSVIGGKLTLTRDGERFTVLRMRQYKAHK